MNKTFFVSMLKVLRIPSPPKVTAVLCFLLNAMPLIGFAMASPCFSSTREHLKQYSLMLEEAFWSEQRPSMEPTMKPRPLPHTASDEVGCLSSEETISVGSKV